MAGLGIIQQSTTPIYAAGDRRHWLVAEVVREEVRVSVCIFDFLHDCSPNSTSSAPQLQKQFSCLVSLVFIYFLQEESRISQHGRY